MISLSPGDVFAMLLSAFFLLFSLWRFEQAHPNATPAQLDTETAKDIEHLRRERENMDRYERIFLNSGELQKHTVETLSGLLHVLVPLVPLKTLAAVSDFVDDVTVPGQNIPPADDGKG